MNTKALVYPWIDFKNETWLKNSVLFWDHLQTITPESIPNPYTSKTAMAFLDEGIISPFFINPSMPIMDGIANDFMQTISSPDGLASITENGDGSFHKISFEKFPYEFERYSKIHSSKLPYELIHMISDIKNQSLNGGKWLYVEKGIANIYMSILASKISEHYNLAPLTDSPIAQRMQANLKTLSSSSNLNSHGRMGRNHDFPLFPSVGSMKLEVSSMLFDYIIESINLDPDTDPKTIISFRRKYKSELARFRIELNSLTKDINLESSLPSLKQSIADIYINKVQPALDDIHKSLKSANIKFLSESILKTSCYAIPSTSIPLALLGLQVPHALFVGAGISVIGSIVISREDRKAKLRENPYSYLYKLNNEF
jgi:hypothetical protein